MEKLAAPTKFVTDVLQTTGSLVDKAVPIAVGSRTQLAVLGCMILGYTIPLLLKLPNGAALVQVVFAVQQFLCGASGAFAFAGLVRSKSAS